MLKKLILCLTLVLALTIGSSAIAMENEQECTMIKGSRVVQVMPNTSLRGVTVPEDIDITIGPELVPTMVNNLNSQTPGVDWTGAHMGMISVDFGQGPMPLVIVVKIGDVKDCK